MGDAWARLQQLKQADLPTRGGRTLGYAYDSGLTAVHDLAARAVADFAGSNGLDPTAFPSLRTMENELVGFACDLVEAPHDAVGTLTSGGTESIMLAVQGARDARPDIERPTMVVPSTIHPSFLKAAHYFGVRPIVVPVGLDYRAEVGAMAQAMGQHTVLAVASAPSYAHGVVDPIAWLGAAALAKGVPLHVDAAIGGWILAYADRIGRVKPSWNFSVPGVSSITIDLHKYAYTPKGASILLHRSPQGRRPTYFASARWPGYTMINTTMASTRAGGPIAGAWTTVMSIGHEGYVELARQCLDAVDLLVAGIEKIPSVHLAVPPDSTLIALRTDASCDVFTLSDELNERGWAVQPQMSWHGEPPSLHLSVSAATLPVVDELLAALRVCLEAARERGPERVDPAVLTALRGLDPAALSDADFDELLVAAGLAGATGAVELPERMAPINALFDAAPPTLRETLLSTYFDRLYRPVRSG